MAEQNKALSAMKQNLLRNKDAVIIIGNDLVRDAHLFHATENNQKTYSRKQMVKNGRLRILNRPYLISCVSRFPTTVPTVAESMQYAAAPEPCEYLSVPAPEIHSPNQATY